MSRYTEFPGAQETTAGESDCNQERSVLVRMRWARLLKRGFDGGSGSVIAQCACGGMLKRIAVIEQPNGIEKIWMRIGLNPRPPHNECK